MKILNVAPILCIIFLAAFVRLYKIADFTQFRGDQGGAGVIIYEAFQNKELPLVGPTVSTGQRPGPAYYYLIALPFILSHFNPVVPAIMFALLGICTVWLLYYAGSRMFGTWPGIVTAALYACSPTVVAQDRTMWNPTAIPFFVTVMIFSLYKIHQEKKKAYILLAATSLGILIQLHYTNMFWIPVLFAFWCYECFVERKKRQTYVLWSFFAFFAFFFPLAPFLYYEARHQFIDIVQIATLSTTTSETFSFLHRLQFIVGHLFSYPFPVFPPVLIFAVALFFIMFALFMRRTYWSFLFAAIAVFGIGILTFLRGPMFDHYLWFLYPIPFLLIGSCFSSFVPKQKQKISSFLLILIIICMYLPTLGLTKNTIGDIKRTQALVDAIIIDSQGKKFSFTLFSSPSFSDYHYRFFFRMDNVKPQPVTDTSYSKLYIICEAETCPSDQEVQAMYEIRALCYDHVCRGEYPKIVLRNFRFIRSKPFAHAKMYVFQR